MKGKARVGGLHKGLADEEAPEARLAEAADSLRTADAALADLDGVRRQALCQPEGIIDVGNERGC